MIVTLTERYEKAIRLYYSSILFFSLVIPLLFAQDIYINFKGIFDPPNRDARQWHMLHTADLSRLLKVVPHCILVFTYA